MEPGTKFICQYADWFSAHGKSMKLEVGQRLTLAESYRVGGALFYRFAETPEDCGFLSTGFKSLRSLN